jgi:hypothetical protein
MTKMYQSGAETKHAVTTPIAPSSSGDLLNPACTQPLSFSQMNDSPVRDADAS